MHSNESSAHRRKSKDQGAFLKALILRLESEERHRLHESLAKAERDGNCIRRAIGLVVVMLMISGAGLGYCALLLPEVFRDHTHLLTRSLSVLGLGSLISQVVFLGCLLWHRAVVTRLHEDCRHLVLALVRSQLKVPATQALAFVSIRSLEALLPDRPPSTLARHRSNRSVRKRFAATRESTPCDSI